MATVEEQIAQLQAQQSLQSRAIAQILANHYQDGPASSKGLLVQLDPDTYTDLAVVEKENAGKADAPPDGGGGDTEYPVLWVPSPNHYDSIKTVWALVIHTMAGSLSSCDSWFANPSSQVSSHYGVGLDGALHQYVSLEQGSWANGILEAGNLWSPYFGSSDNPNYHTVTIETEDRGDPNQPVTDAEYAGTLAACHLAIERWGSINTLTTHRAISPNSRPSCAGARWWGDSHRLQQLAADLGLALLL